MFNRLGQPLVELPASVGCDALDDPLGPGSTLLGGDGLGQAGLHQSVQGSIDQRPANCEHSTDLAIRIELLGQGEAVAGPFAEKTENRALGG